jgi:hypothetical protein
MPEDARLAVWQERCRAPQREEPQFVPEESPLIEIRLEDQEAIEIEQQEIMITGAVIQSEQGEPRFASASLVSLRSGLVHKLLNTLTMYLSSR